MKLVFARYRASSDNYLISFVSSSRLDFYLLCLYTFFCKNVYFFRLRMNVLFLQFEPETFLKSSLEC